ncbi:glycosyltransferase family 4 protein [Kribbella sandramycini]|uniref:Glycosyltransferase family 4 protein n=1 Tax=Kribbella sandramycini TaxID=60450 RepID=A0A7Y4L5Z4_9ACTN|nr:glycosyltransferase involved in cell wall biosynthesis [Kribbella sandramycini]NOL44977.1 glycosyltransferase family 4 protein [Kribbella sandramycini]
MSNTRRTAPDVGIITTGHDVADARLHKITAALQHRDLTVELWGLGEPDGGPAGAVVHAGPRGNLLQRLARTAVLPWRTKAKVVMTVDPDMIPVTRLVTTLRRRKMVADIHEDYTRLLADRAWAKGPAGLPARLIVRASSKLAAGADLTVVADSHLAPHEAKQRLVVQNFPYVPFLALTPPTGAPRAVYVGDLRASRGLFDMVETVAAAPDWSLDLIGPVAPSDRDALEARIEQSDLAGRVRLHGRQPPADAWQLTQGAWASLAMLQPTPAFVEAMPSKIYEYLASGLPVLSTRLPRQTRVIEESGGGVLVDSVAEASETLRRWSADPGELEKLRDHALQWAAANLPANTPYDELADAILNLLRGS